MTSRRTSTTKNYNSSWRKWEQWSAENNASTFSPSIGNILNFLASKYSSGRGYRSLNCYRSALSSVLALIEGFDVGRHPLVCRMLKERPPLPKHSTFWPMQLVLDHISSWGENNALSKQRLTWKLAMLLALCSALRSSEACADKQ